MQRVKPFYHHRYVDDTFLLLRHKSRVKQYPEYLNTQHCYTKFAIECEEGGDIYFLDCSVYRRDNKSETSFFRVFSLFNFYTFQWKLNSIKTFLIISWLQYLITASQYARSA